MWSGQDLLGRKKPFQITKTTHKKCCVNAMEILQNMEMRASVRAILDVMARVETFIYDPMFMTKIIWYTLFVLL